MSLYSQYIEEREGKKIIEHDHGFITYSELDEVETVLIGDFFIEKEHRGTGLAKELCNEVEKIAKNKNYQYAMATVDVSTNNWEHSKNILENYGFKPSGKDGFVIYFMKELHYGK